MQELISFEDKIILNKNIAEITSISLDYDYKIKDNKINGTFDIEGTYKSHELSMNTNDFSNKLPFIYELNNDCNIETVKLNVKDFTYEIDANALNIIIDYEISYELNDITFEERSEFDKFLESHEVDLVELTDDKECEDVTDNVLLDEEDIRNDLKETVLETVTNKDDTFITYHIYVCMEEDTLESISQKFNVKTNVIKEYNDIDSIFSGMKIIIPDINE